MDETFPDIGAMSDQELKDLIETLTEEEQEISYRRRILHGKIDILRAELVNRLRSKREHGRHADQGRRRRAPEQHPRRPGRRAGRGRLAQPEGPDHGCALPRVWLRQRRGRQLLPEVRRLPLAARKGRRASRRR